jgi:FAD/FMN-containing dehydrogenase
MREEAYRNLSAKLRGSVITPGSDEYEVARRVYNRMIDRRPDAIVRCLDVADVMTAVNFARNADVTVAVRGGGHNGAGLGVCDRGLVIDLSSMKGVLVNPATNTIRAAFSYRDAKWSMVIVGVDPDPANAEKITAWTKDYWAALCPCSLGGAYVNFMMDEGIERVKATYRDNHDRLLEIKRKYDPNNFFRINQNITPD